jgi:hypothetical protein
MKSRSSLRLTLLAFAVANPSQRAIAAPEPPGQVLYLRKPIATSYAPVSDDARLRLTTAGARSVEDYGPFALVAAPASARSSELEDAAGLPGLPYPGAFDLDVGGAVIDYRLSDRDRSEKNPLLFLEDYPKGGRALYVVKLVGPARRDWLEGLERLGVRILQYVHQDAYILEAPAGIAVLRTSVRYPVVYLAPYHPFYKVAPDLRDSADHERLTRLVVLLDAGQDTAPARALLKKLDEASTFSLLRASEASATLTTNREGWMALATLPSVVRIEPAREASPSDERANQVAAGRIDGQNLPTNPGLYRSWLSGLCGGCLSTSNLALETVEVMDTGLAKNPSHQDLNNAWNSSRLKWEAVEFGQGGGDPDDVSYHGTFVTGVLAGDPVQTGGTGLRDGSGTGFYFGMGIAPGVSFGVRKVFQTTASFPTGLSDPASVNSILSDAWGRGARYHNDSWNYADTTYSATTREFDFLVRDGAGTYTLPTRGFPIVVAAGNASGTDYRVRAPGTAKNVITVGASGLPRTGLAGNCNTAISIRDLPSNSRQGIASDPNRFKPDLVAPGRTLTSARADGNTQWDCGNDSLNQLPPPDNPYMAGHGTSFSTPQVTGAAVLATRRLLYDGFARPSPALLKALLVGATASVQGGWNFVQGWGLGWEPSVQGWGRLGLARILEDGTPRRFLDEDKNATPVRRFTSSGGFKNFAFSVADPSKEIVVVLAYTDRPAQAGASVARVNELDLYVLQGGAIYCDGQYTGQYSTRSSGCWLPDMYNNVKRARIAPNSFSGTFTVQIVAGGVNQNAVPGLDGNGPNQDWALYVYNAY